ncbi:MAG: hypothetical protein GVY19_12140 [Bacteroidetes bacterium]|jgi:nucleoside diphosphate kinase|nr:hypothetical protein [Bacteroidota bacterium]
MSDLSQQIIDKIQQARQEKVTRETFYTAKNLPEYKNEFLFFIKPEITLPDSNVKLDEVIPLILKKLELFGLTVKDAAVLAADYLDEHNIIAQHYGVINQLSKDVHKTISPQAVEKFKEIYNKDFEQCKVFGSLEFLEEFPEFTPLTLDYLWQNKSFHKLAGGTYIMDLNFNGTELFLVDGFHPRQLDHFVQRGRSIITMTLVGNTFWIDARSKLIGATNPEKAAEGSLRRTFLEHESQLGLPAMSSSWNGVHLSAGPVEGLIELIRYNSDFENNHKKKPADYPFGQQLIDEFGDQKAKKILANEDIQLEGESISVFDATEEKDSDAAIEILKKAEF